MAKEGEYVLLRVPSGELRKSNQNVVQRLGK